MASLKERDLLPLFAAFHAQDFGLVDTHVAGHSSVRVRVVGDGEHLEVVVRELDAGSGLRARLNAVRDENDEHVLGELSHELADEIERYGTSLQLIDWLATDGMMWARERRRGLVVAIEVGARLDVRDVDALIAEVLGDPDGDPFTKRIAAHRARHVSFQRDDVRRDAWEGLRRWLEAWVDRDTDRVVPALPSAAIGGLQAVDWMLAMIEHRHEGVATGAAMGLLYLLSGSTRPRLAIDDTTRDRVVHAACRVRSNRPDQLELNSTLVWLLGPAATAETLREVVTVVSEAFHGGRGDQPAAAIEAARMLVRGPTSSVAAKCLQDVFRESSETDRFWRLVNHPRPSWPS